MMSLALFELNTNLYLFTCIQVLLIKSVFVLQSGDYQRIEQSNFTYHERSCLLSLCLFYRVVTTRGSSSPISRGSMTTPVHRPASCGGVSSPSTAWVRPRHTVTTTSSVEHLSSSPLTLTETVSCFSSSF